jgi:hypothetical protein
MTDKDVALPIELVEKILRTEMVLERVAGTDVTAANYIEALSAVGIRAKQMKDAEVEPAIKLARQLVSERKVENAPEEVRKELRGTGHVEFTVGTGKELFRGWSAREAVRI